MDYVYYLSATGFSSDAMLNIAKIEVELIPDSDMYISLRNIHKLEVLIFSNRYSKVNNKYLKSCDPKLESKDVIYLDANNFYVYAMSKFLSTCGFRWIDLQEFDLNKRTNNSLKRCVLEIYLKFPKELRELHNDYPLALYKIEIERKMLSGYQLKIVDLYNIPIGNVKKLASKIFDKEKYVIHYENSQLSLRLGLKLKECTALLEFKYIAY